MVLSYDLVESARAGDVATVEQWLNAGGDANERCATMGRTLLHCIASDSLRSDEVERGRCDIARLLLAWWIRRISSPPPGRATVAAAAPRRVRSPRIVPSRSRGAYCRDALGICAAHRLRAGLKA